MENKEIGKVEKKNLIRRNLILSALLEEKQLSLTDISKHTGISLPVVSSIVNSLKEIGFVIEVEDVENSQAGRPPLYIKLKGDAAYKMGVNLGRTETNIVLLDLENNIIADVEVQAINTVSDPSVVDKIYNITDDLLKKHSIEWNKILGVGIALPGILQGPVANNETYYDFLNVQFLELCEQKFKKPIFIKHDIKALTLGELNFGLAKGRQNVLFLGLGMSISLGIVINGKLYNGSKNLAGEFGHMQLSPEGPLCYCGKRGCIETVASGWAVARQAREKIAAGAETMLAFDKTIDLSKIDVYNVAEAANRGDNFCIELIEDAGKYIGYGLARLINIFNPELIIMGERVTGSDAFLVNAIKSTALKHSLTHMNRRLEFDTTNLAMKAGALGAAIETGKEYFEFEHLNPSGYM